MSAPPAPSGFAWEAMPRVVGHRGSPREAIENTLASFQAAFAAGATAVELDARLTRDGAIVVHHDAELGRVAPGSGLIEELTLDEIRARSGGLVPTLADVLDALPASARVDVELKADALNAHALPIEALKVIRAAGAVERALVTSFDPALADEYARLSGRPAGAILPFVPEAADLEAWPRLRYVALSIDAAEEDAVRMARGMGRRVLAWTVNSEKEAWTLLARGVEGIITDRPGPLLRALEDATAPGSPGASAP